MSIIHAPKRPDLDGRHLLFPCVMLICLAALLLRLWYLQVVAGPELAERANASGTVSFERLAPRGLIFDRRGKLIAGIQSKLVVTAVPYEVDRQPQVVDRVAAILGAPAEKLRSAVAEGRWRSHFPTPIFVGATIQAATRIAEMGDDLPGIAVETQPMRYYPDSHAFAHVLGYVWTPNERDVQRLAAKGIDAPGYVGKTALEANYDAQLLGRPGLESYEVDARRRPLRLASRDLAQPGSRLNLALDADLQKFALGLLKGRRGAVVAIEPSSGDVLCLASSPSYNVGPFIRGIRQDEFDKLRKDKGHPLVNRAFDVSALYSPGSTFKPVTMIAAVRAGVFDPSRVVVCPGSYQVGDRRVKCLGKHGAITFEQALAVSCNTYFSDLAVRAGPEELRRAALDCGFGARTGLDLPNEGKGIVPTTDWIRRWRANGKWYPGDTVNLGIGQGEIAVTPLQMADLAALIANEGVAYRPHLVRSPAADSRAPVGKVDLPASIWFQLRQAMVAAIQRGSARSAQISGIEWAGKTGSAEKRGQNRTDSWFIGFAPARNPKIAICVVAEDVGHGAAFAAPVAREVVKRYLSTLSMQAAGTNQPTPSFGGITKAQGSMASLLRSSRPLAKSAAAPSAQVWSSRPGRRR